MKKVEIKIELFSFDELSKKAKQKAVEKLFDINTMGDWWDSIYDDAKTIGIKLDGFDFTGDRVINLVGTFITSAGEVMEDIRVNHGKTCDTYKVANEYKHSFNLTSDEAEKEGVNLDEVEDEFLNKILKCYAKMLEKEYEYLSSKKAIIETIEANDYLFFKDGELAHCTTYVGKHPKAGTTEFHLNGNLYPVIEEEVANG